MSFQGKSKRIFFILWIFVSACGYRFAGSGNLPAGVNSVFIKVFENRSSETGLENIFTDDLIYEFVRKKKAADIKSADSFLSGVIRSVSSGTISHKGESTSLEQRVMVTVDIVLKDLNGKISWAANGIAANETYDVVSDKTVTEKNRRDAVSEASEKLAENIYFRLTEDF